MTECMMKGPWKLAQIARISVPGFQPATTAYPSSGVEAYL